MSPLTVPRRIDALGAGLFCLITAGLYVGAIDPVIQGNAGAVSLRQVLAEREREAQRAEAEHRAKKDEHARTERAAAQGALKLLPQSESIAKLREITAIAQTAGLRVDQFAPGKPMTTPRFVGIPIRLSGTGTYDAAARFLADAHAKFEDVKVTSFRLVASPEDSAKSAFEFNLVWHADKSDSVAATPTP